MATPGPVRNLWPFPLVFANRSGVKLSCNRFQWVFQPESIQIDSAVDHWKSIFQQTKQCLLASGIGVKQKCKQTRKESSYEKKVLAD